MTDRPTRVNAEFVERPGTQRRAGPTVAGHFDCGPRYRTRRPGPDDLLLFIVESGAGIFRSISGEIAVPSGHAAVCLPGAAQDYGTCPSAGRWRFRWCHAMPLPHWWASLRWPGPWEGLGVVELDDPTARREATAALRRAADVASAPVAGAQALATNAAEAALLWCASRSRSTGRVVDGRVRAASDLARRRPDRHVTVAEMAAAACVSEPRLTVLFREQLGESPARHAESLRLGHAARLLTTTGLSSKEVAAACGYDDPSHFSRRFRSHFGRPPSRYMGGGQSSR